MLWQGAGSVEEVGWMAGVSTSPSLVLNAAEIWTVAQLARLHYNLSFAVLFSIEPW